MILLLVALTGCDPAADFETRARTVAGAWQASAEREHWTGGFVLLGHLSVGHRGRLPRWVGRSEINDAWSLETPLPSGTPAPALLRWADGGTLTVPLIPAAAAYAGLTKPHTFADEKCPAAGCRPLRVTAVARGEATVHSSRGEVRVPTWDFTVEGVGEPFRRVAVDPSALGGPPRRLGDLQEVQTYETPAPTELRLSYLHGACDTTHGARVHETPEVIVVDVDVRGDHLGNEVCPAIGKIDQIAVTLREPLGRRVVLDSRSGLPLLPKSDLSRIDFVTFDARES